MAKPRIQFEVILQAQPEEHLVNIVVSSDSGNTCIPVAVDALFTRVQEHVNNVLQQSCNQLLNQIKEYKRNAH